ncbi:MAG: hypothetical protein HY787_06365 [Deltaproteobacteria bacterium]|nr:hypothetical protein [Deltaproteobacteria bacterium]
MMMALIRQEKGTALVGVLMILLVLTLLGTNAFLNSTTELKISTNYNQNLQSLYAAEGGIHLLLAAYRQNPDYFLQKKTGPEMNFPSDEQNHSTHPGTPFWLLELRYDPQELPTYAEVIMAGRDSGQNCLSRIRATIYCVRSGGPLDVPPIFQKGIVTAGQLHLSGSLEIRTNLHANQGYSLDPSSVIDQLKQNQYSVTQSLDPTRSDFVSSLEVPVISETRFQEYRSIAQQAGNQLFRGNQNLSLSGDQKNSLLFVDGDLTLQANHLCGVTIVATGSITINGSTRLADDHRLDVAFIAGQDIILNDFSQIAGVSWSNRTVKKTGTGRLMGTIVCQGPIFQSGGMQFERVSQISNTFLSPSPSLYSFTLNGWSQI